MAHHPSFIVKPIEESPFYREADVEYFRQVRAITGDTRMAGTHGCKLAEIVPGVWTCHFEDIKEKDSFASMPIAPPIGLVVNSACVNNQCPTADGYYGPDVTVLTIELYDDPKEGEAHEHPSDPMIHFAAVNAAIESTLASGKSALVHCMASLSRSVALILAYLIEKHNMPLLEAVAMYKTKWDAVWPNDGYVFQLIEFERQVKSSRV